MPILYTTNNKTPYAAETITLLDESIVSIVKATFNFSTRGEVYTNDKPRPAGYGFIAPNWEPRLGYAGINTDDPGKREQDPQLLENFDTRFYNAAAPDLVSENPLSGTETVIMNNLHPETSHAKFNLPGINPITSYIYQDRTERILPVLDTLVLEPDENLFTMVWRSGIFEPDDLKNLVQVNISETPVNNTGI